MKYKFCIDKMIPEEKPGHFKIMSIEASGNTPDEAFLLVKPQIPVGHKMFAWWPVNDDGSIIAVDD